MKRILFVAMATFISFSSAAWSYDQGMAESYADFFKPVTGAKAGKALHLLKSSDFIEKIKSGEKLVLIDIRTPAETDVFTVVLPDSLVIPAHKLFQPENLERIPTNKTVVIICQSGSRSIAVGTALRHIGFDNVYILKGGFKELSNYLNPVSAND